MNLGCLQDQLSNVVLEQSTETISPRLTMLTVTLDHLTFLGTDHYSFLSIVILLKPRHLSEKYMATIHANYTCRQVLEFRSHTSVPRKFRWFTVSVSMVSYEEWFWCCALKIWWMTDHSHHSVMVHSGRKATKTTMEIYGDNSADVLTEGYKVEWEKE